MAKLPTKLQNVVRAEFEDTCKRRFFFGPAFDPYGGAQGLFDLGPPLCSVKANVLQFWRQHFVLEESMCEVDTTCCTPYEVLEASGHVERFNDVMTRDTATGECIRIDKHIEEWCEEQLKTAPEAKRGFLKELQVRAESMTPEEFDKTIAECGIKSPAGNPLAKCFAFNLMFKSPVGAEGTKEVFFRPELAQGIILNFKRFLDSNNASRLPFAGAAIGQAFRNEIAPRSNLLRVREFTLAEIEHFVNPEQKQHPKFSRVADIVIWAWTRESQNASPPEEPYQITIGEAVAKRIIDNETLGYFIGRTAQWLQAIGVREVRWRQHVKLAHYAQDCWDAEALTTYGWYEIIGIADRSAYDLTQHMKATGKDLKAREEFAEARMVEVLDRKINKGVAGKKFGKEMAAFLAAVESIPESRALEIDKQLDTAPVTITHNDKSYELSRDLVKFSMKTEKVTGRNFTPGVIEPSFGIGRILYVLLEQSYWVRRDDSGKNEKRAVFSFKPVIAPQKVAILPLMVKPELDPLMTRLRDECVMHGLSNRSDDSGAAIGKKYARIDELGIPFCVTCDFVGDGRVTLRERDTTKQVRVPIDEVVSVISSLCRTVAPRTWDNVLQSYPVQEAKEADN